MSKGLATRCIHSGEIADASGSLHTRVYTTTPFAATILPAGR